MDRIGRRSVLSCPDYGCVMSEIDEGGTIRTAARFLAGADHERRGRNLQNKSHRMSARGAARY
jgi:hypothetical protein